MQRVRGIWKCKHNKVSTIIRLTYVNQSYLADEVMETGVREALMRLRFANLVMSCHQRWQAARHNVVIRLRHG